MTPQRVLIFFSYCVQTVESLRFLDSIPEKGDSFMIRFMALVCGIVFSVGITKAEDEPGSIGVQLKIEDGKIMVVEPIEDSPAAKAGVKAGDIILKLNDYKVKDDVEMEDLQDLVNEVGKQKPGSKVKLAIKRDGKEMTIEITVGKRSEVIKKKDME